MAKGWVKLHREITSHWLFEEQREFSKFEAWIDLMLMASHQERKVMADGELVTVERGCIITSIRSLCQRWKWSNTKTTKYLATLETDGMIIRKSDTKNTLVTLVNYDKFQGEEEEKTTQKRRENDAETPPKRRQNDAETSPKRHQNDTQENDAEKTPETLDTYGDLDDHEQGETTQKRRQNDAETPPKRHQNDSETPPKRQEQELKNDKHLNNVIPLSVNARDENTGSVSLHHDNGKPNVLGALLRYNVGIVGGVLHIERIESYMGMMEDALILDAIKRSSGKDDAYVVGILKKWNKAGYRKLEDHPEYKEGGEGGGLPNVGGSGGQFKGRSRTENPVDKIKSTDGWQKYPKRGETTV